jgi:class 3 adenylate cyclase/streptogramin lyase
MQRRIGGRGLGAVLFTDIVGSTAIAAEMGNTRWGELVARHHRIVRRLISRFGGHEVDTAGDGFFVTFERPADAIRCAAEATEAVRGLGIEIRAGVSFGELETVGRKPGGLVVNTAARVMSVAGPGEVLVPASVREIVPGGGITFAEHGVHQLKGLDGEFRLFGVTGIDGREVVPPLEAEEAAERRREIFPAGGRRWALLVGAGAGVVALIVGGWILLSGDGADERPRTSAPQHAVASIDAETGAIESSISLGGAGAEVVGLGFVDHPLAAGEGGVWLMRPPSMLHIDPLHEEVRSDLIDLGVGQSQTVVTGFDAVWALSARTVYRVHPGTDEVEEFLVLPIPAGITTWSLSLGDAIWVGVSDGTVVRLDPRTGARDQVDTELSIDLIAASKDGVWVADILAGAVIRFDPESLRREGRPVEIRGSIDQMVARGDFLWILDRQVGLVTRIDVHSNTVSGSARVGDDATDMAVGQDTVWVGDLDGSVYGVDAATLQVRELPIGPEVLGVAVEEASGSVWVYLGKAAAPAGG